MRWRVLGPVLGVILLGAILFSLWPAPPPPLQPEVRAPPGPAAPPPTTAPVVRREPAEATPPPVAIAAPAAPSAPPEPPREFGEPDPEVDSAHLQALGVRPEDFEPLDGGPLHALTRDGIRGAVAEELPAIRECYESWLQQYPTLGGKLKVEFTITEIPGRDRAKITRVEIPDGGIGHIPMEGCVRNVFKGMRFEAPRRGEMKVTYPLAFESTPPANP
ncbi:MAG: AgmX/PglI C-terminal domain-containing protein [Archangium sp.]|nr:AgmX/PglI C-terminal domain-containing protein [Archangium sp.]